MIECDVLGKEPDTAPGGGITEWFAEHSSGTRRWTHEAHREMNCGAFACAVRSEETKNFSRVHGQRKLLQGVHSSLAGPGVIFFRDRIKFKSKCHENSILFLRWRSCEKWRWGSIDNRSETRHYYSLAWFGSPRNESLEVTMLQFCRMLWSDDQGQDIAEYAVMLAVILVLVIGTVRLIGGNANNAFSTVASSMSQ